MKTQSSLFIVGIASPVYWPNQIELKQVFDEIIERFGNVVSCPVKFQLLYGKTTEIELKQFEGKTAVIVPLSGGIQPLLIQLSSTLRHIALANAYLPSFSLEDVGRILLHKNAHPACTDFFAHCRLAGKKVHWLFALEELKSFALAFNAVTSLRNARILRIGETEPWVINSARNPERFKEALGCEIVPLKADELYDEYNITSDTEPDVVEISGNWWSRAKDRIDHTSVSDALKAARVAVAMKKLLARYDADGLAMACFAMIGVLDTTSCLALSTLNDSAQSVGACEGDLDAAMTLFLLKRLGADFVWIANPIVHPGNVIDLAHCTAPRCACGQELSYRLMRHHESGRGIAPEVNLPDKKTVTLARIGANLTELCVHHGVTESVAKQCTCHTQIRVHIPSSRRFLDTLNGTHVVMSYGEWGRDLMYSADLLGLKMTGTANVESDQYIEEKTPTPRRASFLNEIK